MSHILVLTGCAPYLGGASTWEPLRAAAPDLEFRDLDVFETPPGDGQIPRLKSAIKNAAYGACAIIAHGVIAGTVLETLRENNLAMPVLLLSPIAITKDRLFTRIGRFLINAGLGNLIVAGAKAKRTRMLADREALRKALAFTVAKRAITNAMLDEARQRLADPRMDAFVSHFKDTIDMMLAPNNAFENFAGTTLFGQSPMDSKMHRNIPGTVLENAWSAPMIETPNEVALALQRILNAVDGVK